MLFRLSLDEIMLPIFGSLYLPRPHAGESPDLVPVYGVLFVLGADNTMISVIFTAEYI